MRSCSNVTAWPRYPSGRSFAETIPRYRQDIRALGPNVRPITYVRYTWVSCIPSKRTICCRHSFVTFLSYPTRPDVRNPFQLWSPVWTGNHIREHVLGDKSKIHVGPEPDADIVAPLDDPALQRMRLAVNEGQHTPTFGEAWAVAVRNGGLLATGYNVHLPTEYSPYVDGDPRSESSAGEHINSSTALHAEASLIAHAAKTGLSLEGADLFVSTFPCPQCARLILARASPACFSKTGTPY